MKTIYKFSIPREDNPVIRMPRGAITKSVGIQRGYLVVWALCSEAAPSVDHLFAVRGTGHPITPEVEQGAFIGTVFDGPFVWHIFDLGDID